LDRWIVGSLDRWIVGSFGVDGRVKLANNASIHIDS
jgi:hypothetical protein